MSLMTHHESHISLGSVLAKGSESRESSSHDLIYRNYRIVLDILSHVIYIHQGKFGKMNQFTTVESK